MAFKRSSDPSRTSSRGLWGKARRKGDADAGAAGTPSDATPASGPASRRAALKVESLEARIMLSATWTDADGDVGMGPTDGDDSFTGGDGADLVDGLAGDDALDGAAGDDTFSFAGAADGDVKTIHGGTGHDTIDLSARSAADLSFSEGSIEVTDGDGSFRIDYAEIETIRTADGDFSVLQPGDTHEDLVGTSRFVVGGQAFSLATSGEADLAVDPDTGGVSISGVSGSLTVASATGEDVVLQDVGLDRTAQDVTIQGSVTGTVSVAGNFNADGVFSGDVGSLVVEQNSTASLEISGSIERVEIGKNFNGDLAIHGDADQIVVDGRVNGTIVVENAEGSFSFQDSRSSLSETFDEPTQVTITRDGPSVSEPAENAAPTLAAAMDDVAAVESEPLSFTIPADAFSDADGDELTWSATLAGGDPLPDWLAFDAETRTFSGTPEQAAVGSLEVAVQVTDADGATATGSFTIDVANVNDTPFVLDAVANQAATEHEPFSYEMPAEAFADEDGDPLDLVATQSDGAPLPDWLTFDAGTRTFSGTPGDGDVGELTVSIRATDPSGAWVEDSFTIDVANVADDPSELTLDETRVSREEAAGTVVASVSASDPDPDETFTYRLLAAEGGADSLFELAGDELRVRAGADLAAADAEQTVEIQVTDSTGRTHVASFSMELYQPNRAPVAELVLDDAPATEDAPFVLNLPEGLFSDADADALDVTATLAGGEPLPDWLTFDAGTGTFSGTPANADVGRLDVTIHAEDPDGEVAEVTLAIDVTGTNDAPESVGEVGWFAVAAGSPLEHAVPEGTFIDVDAEESPLELSAGLNGGEPLPDWLAFDAGTGTFTGTPPADAAGVLEVTVTAADAAGATATESFSFVITDEPVTSEPIRLEGDLVLEDFAGSRAFVDGDRVFTVTLGGEATADVTWDASTGSLAIDQVAGTTAADALLVDHVAGDAVTVSSVTLGADLGSLVIPGGGTVRLEDGIVVGTIEPTVTALGRLELAGTLGGDLSVEGGIDTVVADTLAGGGLAVAGDLGAVQVAGAIDADIVVTGSIGSLDAASIGSGADVQASSAGPIRLTGDLDGAIAIAGDAGDLSVGGDLAGELTVGGDAASLTVTGDLAGELTVGGDAAAVSVGGDLAGSASVDGETGEVAVTGDLAGTLEVGGDADGVSIGGTVDGTLAVAGDITSLEAAELGADGRLGISGTVAGDIGVGGDLAGRLEIGGSLGGQLSVNGSMSGAAILGGNADTIRVTGDVGGEITVGGDAATITVDGVVSGTVAVTGDLERITASDIDAVVTAGRVVGTITIADGAETVTRSYDHPTRVVYDGRTGELTATTVGTGGGDTIQGDRDDEAIDGLGGNDRLFGGGGDDVLTGGSGNDVLDGEAGDDRLDGGSGNDRLVGGTGDDHLDGGAGFDTADYRRSQGPVAVDLEAGTATGDGEDTLSSIERVYGSDHDDALAGGDGNDRLEGREGDDRILGRGGSDRLSGGSGDDELLGGDGNDTLDAGSGDDLIDGGAGFDRVTYGSSGSGVTVDLAGGTASGDGEDLLVDVEHVDGSRHDDVLVGDENGNMLRGHSGDDRLEGAGGNDRLEGGGGNDALFGGDGDDRVRGDGGADTLEGNAGDDILDGGSGDDVIDGGDGDDRLVGGTGDDVLRGGAGTDTVDFGGSGAAVDADLERGTASGEGNDRLEGIENLEGTSRSDTLRGDDAANRIQGGGGDDLLEGRGGDDVLVGGDGRDTASYAGADGSVTVDLAAGEASGADGDDRLSGIEDVIGSGHDDDLTGDLGANRLDGGAGDDVIDAGGGDDRLIGGAGDDRLVGGEGDDTVDYAGAGGSVSVDLAAGVASGAAGADVLEEIEHVDGSSHDDVLVGDAGANTLRGGSGDDVVRGGEGDDRLEGGAGADTLEGGDGDDVLRGEDRVMLGGLGDGVAARDGASGTGWIMYSQTEVGERFADDPPHGSQADHLVVVVQSGDQWFYDDNDALRPFTPEAGDTLLAAVDFDADTVQSLEGTSEVIGGIDAGYADGDLAFTAERWAGGGNPGEFEVTGTWFGRPGGADVLDGGAGDDELEGGAGDDRVSGGEGDDLIIGGLGSDVIDGGAGEDTLRYADGDGGVDVALGTDEQAGFGRSFASGDRGGEPESTDSITGVEHVVGTSFEDRIVGNDAANRLDGGAGDDELRGGAGDDRLAGGTGDDRLAGEAGDDELLGGDGADVLGGGAGDDRLDGGRGADELSGGDGDDVLEGGSGSDELAGGAGDDVLVGGSGTDTATYGGNWNEYRVSDNGDGTWTIADTVAGRDGTDVVSGIESFTFADGTLPLSELVNRAPSDLVPALSEVPEGAAGGAVVGTVAVVDADTRDVHRFDLTDDADGRFTIDAESGTIRVAEGAGLDHEAADHHDVMVRVTDASGAERTESVRIEVADVNEAPTDITLSNHRIPSNAGGGTIVGTVGSDEVDAGDPGTWTVIGGGDRFEVVDGALQLVDGAALAPGEGAIDIEIQVIDAGGETVVESFTIDVLDVNSRPVTPGEVADQTAIEDEAFAVVMPADLITDPDGDPLAFTATLAGGEPLPAWLSFDADTGTFSGTPGDHDVDTLEVTVTGTDPSGLSATSSFRLVVVNVQDAPIVGIAADDHVAIEDRPFAFTLGQDTFVDPDGEPLILTASLSNGDPLPAWLAFDAETWSFSGTPDNDDVGRLTLSVTATDPHGASVSESFLVNVANVNDAPEAVRPVASIEVPEGNAFALRLPADLFQDVDASDRLSYEVTMADGSPLPSWARFHEGSMVVVGTAPMRDFGTLDLVMTATDRSGAVAEQGFSLEVVRSVAVDAAIAEMPVPGAEAGAGSGTGPETGAGRAGDGPDSADREAGRDTGRESGTASRAGGEGGGADADRGPDPASSTADAGPADDAWQDTLDGDLEILDAGGDAAFVAFGEADQPSDDVAAGDAGDTGDPDLEIGSVDISGDTIVFDEVTYDAVGEFTYEDGIAARGAGVDPVTGFEADLGRVRAEIDEIQRIAGSAVGPDAGAGDPGGQVGDSPASDRPVGLAALWTLTRSIFGARVDREAQDRPVRDGAGRGGR